MSITPECADASILKKFREYCKDINGFRDVCFAGERNPETRKIKRRLVAVFDTLENSLSACLEDRFGGYHTRTSYQS